MKPYNRRNPRKGETASNNRSTRQRNGAKPARTPTIYAPRPFLYVLVRMLAC